MTTCLLSRRGYWWIGIAIVLALIAGWWQQPALLKLASAVSEIFVRLLKLISLPLISLSLLATISSVGEQSLSRLGKRIVSYTILTTTIAASIAFLLYTTIHPVTAIALTHPQENAAIPSYLDYLLKIVPSNVLQPFLEGNVVSIMLLSLLLGFGIANLPNDQRQPLHHLLQSLFHMMMQITRWIVRLMPIAIWGFMTIFVVELKQGLSLSRLGLYFITILAANLLQAVVILPLFLWWNNISPALAFSKMLPALSFAFFSKSSSAAMPAAIDCAEQQLQVDPKVARFSFPLCTSINMNACAAFILITVLFVAQSHGLTFTTLEKLSWILIATVAAIGNAGVPMGCFFLASALLTTMNVPLTLMGIILPFYTLLDMLESAINIWSDACVTLVVNQKSQLEDPSVVSAAS